MTKASSIFTAEEIAKIKPVVDMFSARLIEVRDGEKIIYKN
jgi:hypothetical protein